ncbi:MAG: hypothetical protein HY040_25775 [Planctomycetes bacterium]|nr:hypothetical protein [Planctomycetota bacterium]
MFQPVFLAVLLALAPDRDGGPGGGKANKIGLEQEVGDISGYYTCKGVESGGKTYSGVAVITKKNEVYVIQWIVGSASTFTGLGIRQGNNFSASWAMGGEKGLIRGVNMYRIEPGPRLIGRWATLPGNGMLQSENLTFLKKLEDDD